MLDQPVISHFKCLLKYTFLGLSAIVKEVWTGLALCIFETLTAVFWFSARLMDWCYQPSITWCRTFLDIFIESWPSSLWDREHGPCSSFPGWAALNTQKIPPHVDLPSVPLSLLSDPYNISDRCYLLADWCVPKIGNCFRSITPLECHHSSRRLAWSFLLHCRGDSFIPEIQIIWLFYLFYLTSPDICRLPPFQSLYVFIIWYDKKIQQVLIFSKARC